MKTVGELRQMLEGVPDWTPVLTTAPDHSYRPCGVFVGTVLYDKEYRTFTEDHEDLTPKNQYGKRIQALVVE